MDTEIKENKKKGRCPVNDVLQFVSGAWTVEIFWNLKDKPQRFGQLLRLLDGVSPKVLTARLRILEERGVITRTIHPTSPPTVEYAMTDLGFKFLPILDAMVQVGKQLKKSKKAQAVTLSAQQNDSPVKHPSMS